MSKPFLIWDLDDTIITTYPEFEKSNQLCAEMIAGRLYGESRKQIDAILQKQRQIDLRMIQSYGLLPSRYEQSWLDTAQELYKDKGFKPETAFLESLRETARDIYIRKYENVPGSVEVIRNLKKAGCSMVILTAGEESIQKKRAEESGAAEFMDEIYVYPYKTPETLQTVMKRHEAPSHAMIGNSLKSDIYPALQNNILGIHVRRETWQADDYDIDQSHPLYKQVNELAEVPGIVLKQAVY